MQPDRSVLAAQWRATAIEDLRVASLLVDESPSASAFHAQQAAEKALKAACVAAIDDAPRTHVISHLLDELERNAEHMPADVRDAARILDRYYAPTRYPDALGVHRPESRLYRDRRARRDRPCKARLRIRRDDSRPRASDPELITPPR